MGPAAGDSQASSTTCDMCYSHHRCHYDTPCCTPQAVCPHPIPSTCHASPTHAGPRLFSCGATILGPDVRCNAHLQQCCSGVLLQPSKSHVSFPPLTWWYPFLTWWHPLLRWWQPCSVICLDTAWHAPYAARHVQYRGRALCSQACGLDHIRS